MRVFRFRSSAFAVLPLVAALAMARPCVAQRPAEVVGRVVDAVAGVPVAGARVVAGAGPWWTTTDAQGAYALRGVDPGRHVLRVTRAGYADTAVVADVGSGGVATAWIALRPVPAMLDAVDVRAAAAEGVRIDAAAIARSGARTAADVAALAPGVVVRATSAGGAETASIRGSDASAVLVLLDGAALNDPVTGVADLSAVAASSLASVTVLPGARSARWGPRAQAGVILLETRRASATVEAEAFVGSLGARGGRVQAGGGGAADWIAGAAYRSLGGDFTFALPVEAGGGSARRTNADATSASAFGAASFALAGGAASVRAGADRLDRGLPGVGYAPSSSARERLDRLRASARWERTAGTTRIDATVAASAQRTRFRDADPPFGLPYDDSARFTQLEARLAAERDVLSSRATVGGGADARAQSIRATQLDDAAPAHRVFAGTFAHARAGLTTGGDITLDIEGRLDRDPDGGDAVASHALVLRWDAGPAALQLAHRSSWSPPGLDDQFFRDAVGVAPNPDLRAERVPGEVEARATAARSWGAVVATAAVSAYAGDVRDMIVWAPDFRFVWSPRNFDVRRRGGEVAVAVETPGVVRAVRASYGYARVTYAAAADAAQLAYRPRHTGHARAELRWRALAGAVDARYTGTRYPAAARVNALPGFWTITADLGRTWRAGPWSLATSLHVDRLLDETDALIFGYPDPGRVAELRVRITRSLQRQDRP